MPDTLHGEIVLQGTLVLSDRLAACGQVVIEDGRIAEIITGETLLPPTVDYGSKYIAPGLIDLHVHGIAGADVMEPTPDSLAAMSSRFAVHGVTGWLASTLTAGIPHLERVLRAVRAYMDGEQRGARVLGVHLEGPWISKAFKGMQNDAHIALPVLDVVQHLIALGAGTVRRVSMAPELPGADSTIRWLRREGVYVSIAHTGATYEEAMHAVDMGATQVTHCFNAMTPLHHRQPGVAGASMLSDDLYTELIADGIHIHPAVMRLLIRVKGRERVMLVTDSMSATERPDGEYEVAGMKVIVHMGEARLENGRLASSTLTMDAAVCNVVQKCGVSVVDAVYMASSTPAKAMGLGERKGALRVGFDADLAILDGGLHARAVWIGGRQIERSPESRPPHAA
ncbi:MAG: N-acetylglucosamine-6-phosphate deacetylase [Chloroflexota bacterium]